MFTAWEVASNPMAYIGKADRQRQLEQEEAGQHLFANRVR
jgi:hypothetical protein